MLGKFVRRHAGSITVALVAATLTAAAPAIGHGVEHALFAHDADKVDGKHAVGSGATAEVRKGKLVATNATTGLLPNNIIAKAPDAGKLDGIDSTGFTRRNGMIVEGRVLNYPWPDANFVLGFRATDPAPDPWVGLYYICPEDPANHPGTLRLTYHGSSAVNVFAVNGGDDPTYAYLTSGQSFDQPAAPSGDYVTFQAQGIDSMATIQVFTLNNWNSCHVQGHGVFSYAPPSARALTRPRAASERR